MKVILINGSPHKHGNTHDMLEDIAGQLREEGIDTKEYWIGTKAVHGCIACGKCFQTHRCIFDDDIVNRVIDEMHEADALVVGTPVYYASANGALDCVLDRVFYAGPIDDFRHKPAACCSVARRAGTISALDRLEKYFTISEMPVVSSAYWPMEFGRVSGETRQDEEGIYVMKRLGKNMAWLLKTIECAKEHGIYPPKAEPAAPRTHFIR